MSITNIPNKIKTQLWTLSGGRCEYRGCNKPLWRDDLTLTKMNKAYFAHIISDRVKGPRGHSERSKLLAEDFSNLMLLCDEHHRLIDTEDVLGHPEELLVQMKKEHEKRIELVTSLIAENKTHLVMYGANIGVHGSPLCYKHSVEALLPNKFPTENYGIELGIKNSLISDEENLFWKLESENLERQFKEKIEPIIIQHSVKDFSVFALAPQPLLIKLGILFSDINNVNVYQCHREPFTWNWHEKSDFEEFNIIEPNNYDGIPILNLSLSATITKDRIEELFDSKVSIWTITHKEPNNDFLKTPIILSEFRKTCRLFFNKVKEKHGQDKCLHVFPAMPVSAAIEFGRVWMPKADMKLFIYDQNKSRAGFFQTLEI